MKQINGNNNIGMGWNETKKCKKTPSQHYGIVLKKQKWKSKGRQLEWRKFKARVTKNIKTIHNNHPIPCSLVFCGHFKFLSFINVDRLARLLRSVSTLLTERPSDRPHSLCLFYHNTNWPNVVVAFDDERHFFHNRVSGLRRHKKCYIH